MKGFFNVPAGPKVLETRLSSEEEWQRYYSERLKIPDAVSNYPFWKSLSVEQYLAIHTQAGERMRIRPYEWSELTLSDVVLLLGNPENLSMLQESGTVKFDRVLLNRAAQLSTLSMVIKLVEEHAIEPFADTKQNTAVHNVYEVLSYIADKIPMELSATDLYFALLGNNDILAKQLFNMGIKCIERDYMTFVAHDCVERLQFLVTHDSDAEKYIPNLMKVVLFKNASQCLKYLVEELHQEIPEDWLTKETRSEDNEKVYDYVESRMALQREGNPMPI